MSANIRTRDGSGSLAQEVHGLNHDAHVYREPSDSEPGQLPRDAALHLADLISTAEDLNGVSNLTFEKLQHEREDRAIVLGHIDKMEREHPDHVDGDKEYGRAKKLAAKHAERIAEITARWERQSATWKAAGQLARSLEDWVRAQAGSVIVPAEHPAPRSGKGETAVQAVERCRARIAELRIEAQRIQKAPLPVSDAKAAARAYVAALAALARPDVSGFMGGATEPFFRDIPALMAQPVEFGSLSRPYKGGAVNDGLSLMAWAQPEALIAALEREIDAAAAAASAIPGAVEAMPASAKAKALAETAEATLALERDEEAFVRMAIATGLTIERRADADPRAVLQVIVQGEAVQ